MSVNSKIVLHVIRTIDPRYGGPVEGIRQLSAYYGERNWKVEIACLDQPGSPWIADFPARIHALGAGKGKYGLHIGAARQMALLADRVDAIVVNGLWEFTAPLVALAAGRKNVPYYVFPHGMLDPWFKSAFPLKHLKKSIYWRLFLGGFLRRAEAVFFTTEEEMTLAKQSFSPYQCNEVLVGYGTSAPSGVPGAQRAEFESSFPEVRGKRNILFLGRIDPKKGCDLLLEAFSAVLKNDPDWHLIMAGPDQSGWRADLEQRADQIGLAGRITWTGPLSGDLKWGAFHGAEAFALPSHQENFGIAVAEALACGVPVLITDKINIWREIQRDDAGLVAPDTLEGAKHLLREWSTLDPSERERKRSASRRCFEKNFEISAAARRLIAHLDTAVFQHATEATEK